MGDEYSYNINRTFPGGFMKNRRNSQGDFDLSRSDKFYRFSIPKYQVVAGVVYYEVSLWDLVNNFVYLRQFRFKEMKAIHEALHDKKFQLPPFPKTHFWSKTNDSPQLIERRRAELQDYFSLVINNPYLRGYRQVKNIIRICKKDGSVVRGKSSSSSKGASTGETRSLSSWGEAPELKSKQRWKSLRRKAV